MAESVFSIGVQTPKKLNAGTAKKKIGPKAAALAKTKPPPSAKKVKKIPLQCDIPHAVPAVGAAPLEERQIAENIACFLNALWHLDVKKDHDQKYKRDIVNRISAGTNIAPYIIIPDHSDFWSYVIEFNPVPGGVAEPNKNVYETFVNLPVNSQGSFRIKPTGQYYEFVKLGQTPQACGVPMKARAQEVYNYFTPPDDNPRKLVNIFTDTTQYGAELISDFDPPAGLGHTGFAHIHTREIEADPATKMRAVNKPAPCPQTLEERFWCEKVDANQTNKVIHYPKYEGPIAVGANEEQKQKFKKTQFFCNYDLFIKMENNPNELDKPDVFMSYKRANGSTIFITENMNKAGGFDKLNQLERQLAGVADDNEALEAVFVSKHAGDILQVLGAYAFPRSVTNFANNNESRIINITSNKDLNIIESIDSPLFITSLLLGVDACIFYLTVDPVTRHVLLVKKRQGPIAGDALNNFLRNNLIVKQQQLIQRYREIDIGFPVVGLNPAILPEKIRIRQYVAKFNELLDAKLVSLNDAIDGKPAAELNEHYKVILKDLATFAYYSRCIPKGFLPNDDAVPIFTQAEQNILNKPIDDNANAVIQPGQAPAAQLLALQNHFKEFERIEKKLNDFPAEFLKICENQIFTKDAADTLIDINYELNFERDLINVVPEAQGVFDMETERHNNVFYELTNILGASTVDKTALRPLRQKVYKVWYAIHYVYFILSLFQTYDITYRNKILYLLRKILHTLDGLRVAQPAAPAGAPIQYNPASFALLNFDTYLNIPPFSTLFNQYSTANPLANSYVMLPISEGDQVAGIPNLPPLPPAPGVPQAGFDNMLGGGYQQQTNSFNAQLAEVDMTLQKIEKMRRGEPLYPIDTVPKKEKGTIFSKEEEPTGIYATSGYMKYFHDFVYDLRNPANYEGIETLFDIPLLLQRYNAALTETSDDLYEKSDEVDEDEELEVVEVEGKGEDDVEVYTEELYPNRPGMPSTRPGMPSINSGMIPNRPGMPSNYPGIPNIQMTGLPEKQQPMIAAHGGSKHKTRKTRQRKRHITKKKLSKPRRRQTSRKQKP